MTFTTWMIAGGVVIAAAAWVFFWRAGRKAKAAAHWPVASGVVTRSEVQHRRERDVNERMEDRYQVAVAYDYQVQGASFTGRRIGFGQDSIFGSESAAMARLAAYPVGARVLVRYNPDKPAEAVLEAAPPALLFPIIVSLTGAVFVLVGLILRFAAD